MAPASQPYPVLCMTVLALSTSWPLQHGYFPIIHGIFQSITGAPNRPRALSNQPRALSGTTRALSNQPRALSNQPGAGPRGWFSVPCKSVLHLNSEYQVTSAWDFLEANMFPQKLAGPPKRATAILYPREVYTNASDQLITETTLGPRTPKRAHGHKLRQNANSQPHPPAKAHQPHQSQCPATNPAQVPFRLAAASVCARAANLCRFKTEWDATHPADTLSILVVPPPVSTIRSMNQSRVSGRTVWLKRLRA